MWYTDEEPKHLNNWPQIKKSSTDGNSQLFFPVAFVDLLTWHAPVAFLKNRRAGPEMLVMPI